jgi:H+/Cl- antiporter ClcA
VSDVEVSQPYPARQLLMVAVPALVIGVASALLLLALYAVSGWLENILWDTWPSAMGVDAGSGWWTLVVLVLTGIAVGLVVWQVPGHGGPDPATQSLVSPPLPLRALPSLTLALVIMLAGGPSLGPENPIMAIAIALAIAAGHRLAPAGPPVLWAGLATAGMIGAMFGTPVAAALILSGMLKASEDEPLWDQLFGPLIAAAAGSLTVALLEQPTFAISIEPYPGPELIDLLTASLIAFVAAALGLASVYAFPHLHRLFHQVPNPLLMLTLGGAVLGVLGAIGGQITLFRGLEQLGELAATTADYSIGGLAVIVAVKLVALLVSATSGFPGGRIFPAVFLGGAFGLFANAAFPDIPAALCVAAGVLGFVLAIARDGWVSLFIAVVVVGEVTLLPILLVATLPAWLLLTGKPNLVIKPPAQQRSDEPDPL